MPLYPFPNVPQVDGVPALARNPGIVNTASVIAQTVIADAAIFLANRNTPQWGVYDSNGQLIGKTSNGTSVQVTSLASAAQKYLQQNNSDAGPFTLSFDYRKETVISDFAIEEGSFAAFNKVERPGNPTVVLIVSGTEEQRTSFLDAVDWACTSTDLYSVVTPEFSYYNHSVESYSYQRTNSKGANVLIVELTLKEIRTVSAAYTKASSPATAAINAPQNPSATPPTNSGMVQAVTPPQSTLKAAYTKLSGLLGGQ